jgi:hypothetical protein
LAAAILLRHHTTADSSFRTAFGSFKTAACSCRTAVCSFRRAVCSFRTDVCSFRRAVYSFRTAVCSFSQLFADVEQLFAASEQLFAASEQLIADFNTRKTDRQLGAAISLLIQKTPAHSFSGIFFTKRAMVFLITLLIFPEGRRGRRGRGGGTQRVGNFTLTDSWIALKIMKILFRFPYGALSDTLSFLATYKRSAWY